MEFADVPGRQDPEESAKQDAKPGTAGKSGRLEAWQRCEIVHPLTRGLGATRSNCEEYQLLAVRNYAEYGVDRQRRVVKKETTVVYKQVLLNLNIHQLVNLNIRQLVNLSIRQLEHSSTVELEYSSTSQMATYRTVRVRTEHCVCF